MFNVDNAFVSIDFNSRESIGSEDYESFMEKLTSVKKQFSNLF